MVALITTLINSPDRSEVVRDKLAAILLTESTAQQALALAVEPTPLDPNPWKLRIFTERTNPWDEFQHRDVPGATSPAFQAPIVNIWADNINYDKRSSTQFSRQTANAIYNIDCYGYGYTAETLTGHSPGDAHASMEAQRAVRLVRNILMSAAYVTLDLTEFNERWIQGIQFFQPEIGNNFAGHVAAARIQLAARFNEFAPQVQGPISEEMIATIKRAENGAIYFTAQFGESPP